MTGQNLINAALKLIAVIDPGQGANATESADALVIINNEIDSMNTERANIPVIAVLTGNLVTGQFAYTFGGGGFSATRPIKIEDINCLITSVNGPTLRSMLKPINQHQWAQLKQQAGATALVPEFFYYDYQYPTGTVNVYPTPTFSSTAPSLEVYIWQILAAFPDLSSDVPIPPGFADLITNVAAVRLASQYGVPVPAQLAQDAAEAKAAFRALNAGNAGMPPSDPPGGALNAIPPAPTPQQGSA